MCFARTRRGHHPREQMRPADAHSHADAEERRPKAQRARSALEERALRQQPGKREHADRNDHRPETHTPLGRIAEPVVFPAHPRTRSLFAGGLVGDLPANVVLVEPLGYLDMAALSSQARVIVTDSGGLQKEAYLLERPCTTVRTETEWPETTAGGWNVLVHPDAVGEELQNAAMRGRPATAPGEPFGDGKAAARAIAEIEAWTAREAETGPTRADRG